MSDTEAGPTMRSYPPRRHLLRDLPFEMTDTGPDAARARLRLTPAVFVGGRLDPGPLLVVTDVLAGLLVGRVIAPDWMATAQLALHLVEPPLQVGRTDAGSPVPAAEVLAADASAVAPDEVVIDASVRRAGRTTIVVEVGLSVVGNDELGSAGSAGDAQLTFVRLPRRDGNLDIADTPVRYGEPVSMSLEDSGLRGTYAAAVGLSAVDVGPAVADAAAAGGAPAGAVGAAAADSDVMGSGVSGRGVVDMAVTPFVQNSFGAVNGGVVASMAAAAAERAASAVLDGPAVALDLTATYLSQGRIGPLRAAATVIRRNGPTALCRVEVTDPGQLDDAGRSRALVVAHVLCLAAGPT